MRVSVLLTPTPEMSRPPHDVSSFRIGRRPVISPDVAEVGGEEEVELPWGSSQSLGVERAVHGPKLPQSP